MPAGEGGEVIDRTERVGGAGLAGQVAHGRLGLEAGQGLERLEAVAVVLGVGSGSAASMRPSTMPVIGLAGVGHALTGQRLGEQRVLAAPP